MTKRVLIVDDHPVFLHGLAALFEKEDDLEVAGTAPSLERARELHHQESPDIVILDLTLGGDSGFEYIRWLRDNEIDTPVLVMSMHEDPVYVERAFREGARGYIIKRRTSEEIVSAVRRVVAGEPYVDSAFADDIAHRLVSGVVGDPVATLSAREFEVFEQIGRGLTTTEIAKMLHRSVKTIETHRAAIKRKLGIANAVELVRYAAIWVEQH